MIELPFMFNTNSLRDFTSAQKRRGALEKQLKIKLTNIAGFNFTEEQVNGRNIENLIGATQIPLGVAGPVRVKARLPKTGTVGQGKHLKFKVSPPVILSGAQRSEGSIDCIAFNMGQLQGSLQKAHEIDLAYTPEIDSYNGFEKLQLKIKDIKIK